MTSVPRSGEELRASAGEPRLDRFELSRSGAARRGSGDESAVVIASDAMTSTGNQSGTRYRLATSRGNGRRGKPQPSETLMPLVHRAEVAA